MEWFGVLEEGMGKSHSLGSGSSNRLLSTFPWVLPSSVSAADSQAGLCLAVGLFGRGIVAGTCLTPAPGCAKSLSSVALVLDMPKTLLLPHTKNVWLKPQ